CARRTDQEVSPRGGRLGFEWRRADPDDEAQAEAHRAEERARDGGDGRGSGRGVSEVVMASAAPTDRTYLLYTLPALAVITPLGALLGLVLGLGPAPVLVRICMVFLLVSPEVGR